MVAVTACIQRAGRLPVSRHTAAGLPRNARAVNASTWKQGTVAMQVGAKILAVLVAVEAALGNIRLGLSQ